MSTDSTADDEPSGDSNTADATRPPPQDVPAAKPLPVAVAPPRDVPLSLRLHAYFGGGLNQLGWLFFGFGMIFYWIFGGAADLESLIYFQGSLETVKGKVTAAEETGYSHGGGKHSRGTPIWSNSFEFTYQGQAYRDVSYGTGKQFAVGRRVDIEIPTGDPSHARIAGMRCRPLSAWVMFVAIFPIVGMCFVVAGVRAGRKAVRLLREGLIAPTVVVEREATQGSVNKKPVYKLHFEFTADDGQVYRTTYNTHEPERFTDANEPLMYHPVDPEYALPLDAVPGPAEFDESGFLRPRSAKSTFWTLFLPGLSIGGHGTVWVLRVLA